MKNDFPERYITMGLKIAEVLNVPPSKLLEDD